MIPQGAPTTWFSTRWHSAASSVGLISMPLLAATAVAAPRGLRLHQGAGRARERQLQHARAAVVGDPAHDVEPSRGSRDVNRLAGREECLQPAIGIPRKRVEAIQRRLKPIHFSRPRRRNAACSTGSIARRSASFAYPTHATSEVTSNGASRVPPAGLVMMTPPPRTLNSP